ncbi:MAG: DNA repair protein RadA [Ruminococcus sp.]|jgi:DNA repair protein RadA/Sms|nr:DNA repair protein RadA [Ruminococcus sp.]
MSSKSAKTIFICRECAYESTKWLGKCPECTAWNSFEETVQRVAPKASGKAGVGKSAAGLSGGGNYSVGAAETFTLKDVGTTDDIRYDTGVAELNRVLGGGLVKGSLILLGGEPGIGKSTLLLQICGKFNSSLSILYISGEESLRQIKLRAKRLGVMNEKLLLASCNDAENVSDTILAGKPDIVIIDSIQTMHTETANGTSGSISQVRECTNIFMRTAKTLGIPIFLVGHVNKDGGIAGPKVMEHIVDTVLQFEGDKNYTYRILRAVKNRYGSTNEIGVFEMTDAGLKEVPNPSKVMLEGRVRDISGNCVACIIEGSRPLLTEVQALVTKSAANFPARIATGLAFGRLNILLAVLEKRAGLYFSRLDVFVNIIGGIRLDEPAGDLPLAIALISAIYDKPIDAGTDSTMAFGEIGLGGEIRNVPNASGRIREAARLGFSRCIVPKACMGEKLPKGIEIIPITHINELLKLFGVNNRT